MKIGTYDVYQDGILISAGLKKTEIQVKYNMSIKAINLCVYNGAKKQGYRLTMHDYPLTHNKKAAYIPVMAVDMDNEGFNKYMTKMYAGVKGNVDRIERLTNNECIRQTVKNLVVLAERYGMEKGRAEVLEEIRLEKGNKCK